MDDGERGPHAEAKIGWTLQHVRRERGLSLEQVEEATKIRAGYLEELERENLDVLPAVYVQGFVRTYAAYLGLDREALVRELKRRRVPEQELQGPTSAGSPKSRVSEPSAAAPGSALSPTYSNRLYLGLAALLVLVVAATALALDLASGSQPAVSQVRQPLISQEPSEASPPRGEGGVPARNQARREHDERGTGNDGLRTERLAGSPARNNEDEKTGRPVQTRQDRGSLRRTRDSRAAPATATTPTTAGRAVASAPPAAGPPARRSAAGLRGSGLLGSSGGVPPVHARVARGNGDTLPGRIRVRGPRSKNFDVRIVVGGHRPVRIAGGVPVEVR